MDDHINSGLSPYCRREEPPRHWLSEPSSFAWEMLRRQRFYTPDRDADRTLFFRDDGSAIEVIRPARPAFQKGILFRRGSKPSDA